MLWNICLRVQRCTDFFILHLFNSVKQYYFACLKYLIGLIKNWMANSKTEGINKRRSNLGRKMEEQDKKERRTSGASHLVTWQVM